MKNCFISNRILQMIRFLLALFILSPLPAFAGDDLSDACNYFYKELEAAPHYSLKLNTGELRSLSDGSVFKGCEAAWKSNVQLMKNLDKPSFEAEEGSELYKEGWAERALQGRWGRLGSVRH